MYACTYMYYSQIVINENDAPVSVPVPCRAHCSTLKMNIRKRHLPNDELTQVWFYRSDASVFIVFEFIFGFTWQNKKITAEK